jgi:hypothetical protein
MVESPMAPNESRDRNGTLRWTWTPMVLAFTWAMRLVGTPLVGPRRHHE